MIHQTILKPLSSHFHPSTIPFQKTLQSYKFQDKQNEWSEESLQAFLNL